EAVEAVEATVATAIEAVAGDVAAVELTVAELTVEVVLAGAVETMLAEEAEEGAEVEIVEVEEGATMPAEVEIVEAEGEVTMPAEAEIVAVGEATVDEVVMEDVAVAALAAHLKSTQGIDVLNGSVDATIRKLEDDVLQRLHGSSAVDDLSKKAGKLSIASKGSSSALASFDEYFPVRPSFGTNGTPVVLWANYFAIKVKAPSLWSYTVNIEEMAKDDGKKKAAGQVKGRKLRLVMEKVLVHYSGKTVVATEFKSQLVSLDRLPLDVNPIEISVPFESDPDMSDSFSVTINGPFEANLDELGTYLQTQDLRADDHVFPRFQESVTALNIVMGFTPRSKSDQIATVGGSRFFPFGPQFDKERAIRDLHQRFGPRPLEALRGFFQSVRPATGQLLLNTNVTCGTFRNSGNAVAIFQKLGITGVPRPKTDDRLRRHLRNVAKMLSKSRVWVDVKLSTGQMVRRSKAIHSLATSFDIPRGGDPQKPKIDAGFEFAAPRNIKFFLKEGNGGRYITVEEHYKQKYGMELGDYPVFNLGNSKNPTYFPAELVEIQPGQGVKTKLKQDETTQMLDHACNPPSFNADLIEKNSRRTLGLDSPFLNDFGISVDRKFLAVDGRKLPAPTVYYKRKEKPSSVPVDKGSWNFKACTVTRGADIKSWSVVQIKLSGNARLQSEQFLDEFSDFMRMSGLTVPRRTACPRPVLQQWEANGPEMDEVFRWAKSKDIKFLVFILSSRADSSLYGRIKTLGDCLHGVHTSCMVSDKMTKGGMSYAANIVLKMNLKAGGANHALPNDLKLLRAGKTMVVGYDVTHPTNMAPPKAGKDEPPSLVGMVSSIDTDLAQWPSTAWEQSSRQEMLGDGLVDAFRRHLGLWQKSNGGSLPANIVIYRDGVSESQFSQVVEQEIPRIRKACRDMYHHHAAAAARGGGKKGGGKPPKQQQNAPSAILPRITLAISVKRHQTRFFPAQDGCAEGSTGNVQAGTIVDRGVTQARYWDFFLTAHHALKGTARPARYTVLVDEIFRADYGIAAAANELEALTHQMCYLYGRATKAVSICPPAYYADIVCERARAHRPDMFDDSDDAMTLETGSVSGATTGGAVSGPSVHADLADSMYYI
ncbi:Piwi domain, partial [Geosmithia morbida]